jgi:hypothetical protein
VKTTSNFACDLRASERLLAFRMRFSEQSIERMATSSPEGDGILATFRAEVAASLRSETPLRRSAKTGAQMNPTLKSLLRQDFSKFLWKAFVTFHPRTRICTIDISRPSFTS